MFLFFPLFYKRLAKKKGREGKQQEKKKNRKKKPVLFKIHQDYGEQQTKSIHLVKCHSFIFGSVKKHFSNSNTRQ